MPREISPQGIPIRRSSLHRAEGIDLKAEPLDPKTPPEAFSQRDYLGFNIGPCPTQRLNAELVKLPITALLRPLMPKHRTNIPEALSLVVE